MLQGVSRLARTVAVTLGPRGRHVVMEQPYGAPKITKDGVTVAKSIEFKDRFENMGAQLVRQAASQTNDLAGDGTTTATVLSHAIVQEGSRAVSTGANPVELKRGIDAGVKFIREQLKSQIRSVKSREDITQVAVISANGDRELGELIGHAMEKVGTDGVITTEDGKTLDTELHVVEGMSLDRGYASPYFVTNPKEQKCEYDNAFVLVSQNRISTVAEILPVLNYVARAGRPLIVVAEDVDGEALTAMILNKAAGKLNVAAVKAPGFGDHRTNLLYDLGVYTGARVLSTEAGVVLDPKDDSFDPSILGVVKKVTIRKNDTVMLGGAGDAAAVNERVELLRDMAARSESDYEREKIKERLAKLAGGVAVIKVGGASDVEVGEKKDRVVDALNATRAAAAHGIVAGAGLALLHSSALLEKEALAKKSSLTEGMTEDQRTGLRILYQAVRRPAQMIIQNAGLEGSLMVHKMLEDGSATRGFDCARNDWCDFFEEGIIDPVLVVQTALTNAASVASMILTTEAAVVDAPSDEKEPAGGMGGMGGAGANPYGGDMF